VAGQAGTQAPAGVGWPPATQTSGSAHSTCICVTAGEASQCYTVTGTHHGGGNADVQMVHTSRWVVVVQVVVHMLMRALPATQHHRLKSMPGAPMDQTCYI
jgi:hypothetical protein